MRDFLDADRLVTEPAGLLYTYAAVMYGQWVTVRRFSEGTGSPRERGRARLPRRDMRGEYVPRIELAYIGLTGNPNHDRMPGGESHERK